ncbi:MAG: hypothetical protein HYR56_00085 [Acidobacteria bacterium]|nr:hypothetical protein [Acidobacteriota bacterium]MBI3423795.1 hypothetical protein [Acidobacteriota bacterium]
MILNNQQRGILCVALGLLLAGGNAVARSQAAPAKPVQQPATSPASKPPTAKPETGKQEAAKQETAKPLPKNVKPEDLVERAIYAYGSRPVMQTIQKNGTMRANVKFFTPEGEREGRITSKFLRKPKLAEDLILIDLDLPGTRYLLGFDGQKTWSISNGEVQEPSAETVRAFRAAHEHSYEALLRYKENEAKLELVGNNKIGPIETDLVEMTLPSGTKTRYEISRRTGRIIYLHYEEQPAPEAAPVKYRLYFTDFLPVQNTIVPRSIRVYANDKVIEERKVIEVAYNVQMEEKSFLAENANKPSETAKQ